MMASGSIVPTEDKARFWRYTLLLSDGGRQVMLEQFSFSDLETRLKHRNTRKKIEDLKDRKKVNQHQLDKLYPPSGKPDPTTFDITLLSIVLTSVFQWWIPPTPDPKDLSKEADFCRLRDIRNETSHSSHKTLLESEFQTKWDDLKQILLRLGAKIPNLEDQIDELREAPIDPAREEELQAIIESWKEKALRPQALTELMTSSKDFLDDCVKDEFYIKTGAYQNAKTVLENEDILVISGLPGEGKTTMAKKLAMELSAPERCIVLDTLEDWVNVDTEKVPIDYLIIDDIFGAGALDQRLAKLWQPCMRKIERRMKKTKFKTIITTRHYILEEAKLVARYDSLTEKTIVHISSNNLSTEERTEILTSHLKKNNRYEYVNADQIQACTNHFSCWTSDKPSNGKFGFPQCVDMFVKNDNLFDKGPTFFSNPNQFFMDVLNDVKCDTERYKFLALILLWARGKIFLHELSDSAPSKDLQCIANRFGFTLASDKMITIRQFLKHHMHDLLEYQTKTGEYKFSHNVIGDMIGLALCKGYQQQTLEYSSHDFILAYVTTDDKKNTRDYFYVEEHEYTYLCSRLVKFILDGRARVRIEKVGFTHTSFFNNKHFVKSFVRYASDNCKEVFDKIVITMSSDVLGDKLIPKDIDIYLPDYFILNNNTLLVHELIDQGDPWGPPGNIHLEQSLIVAVFADEKDTAEKLLKAGAAVTPETVYTCMVAVPETSETTTLLMRSYVSTNSSKILQICQGNIPLIIAAENGLLKWVECLVNEADLSNRNDSGVCALDMAVLSKHTDVCESLIKAGSPVNEYNPQSKQTPLHVASNVGTIEIVRLLLEHDSNVSLHKSDTCGYFPIHCAADRGHTDVIEVLLQHDASLVTQGVISSDDKSSSDDESEMTVYHIAVWKNNRELISMLVNRGATPNIKDCHGRTPLYCAVLYDKVELVNLLLPHSDPNATDKEGRTPLYCAASNGKKHLVELLLPHTDPNVTDKNGQTPLYAAIAKTHMEVANLLCLHVSVNVNIADKDGVTVLHEACKQGDVGFVLDIIETHGANYACRDKAGNTAYDVATPEVKKEIDDKYPDILKILQHLNLKWK